MCKKTVQEDPVGVGLKYVPDQSVTPKILEDFDNGKFIA